MCECVGCVRVRVCVWYLLLALANDLWHPFLQIHSICLRFNVHSTGGGLVVPSVLDASESINGVVDPSIASSLGACVASESSNGVLDPSIASSSGACVKHDVDSIFEVEYILMDFKMMNHRVRRVIRVLVMIL
jgi:hypothetical protein